MGVLSVREEIVRCNDLCMKTIPILKIFAAVGALVALCHCQSHQSSTITAAQSSVFEKSMMDDVEKKRLWETRPKVKTTPADAKVGGGTIEIPPEQTFQPGVDDPWVLLAQAREGRIGAWGKLGDYVTSQSNPDPAIWHEVSRRAALGQGIYGVARYYGESKGNWRASKDRRAIEQAVRQMERQALNGQWTYAVALYKFLGVLDRRTDVHLPWGGNEELSGKWLEIIYKTAGKKAFDNVIKDEVSSTGRRVEPGVVYYPHTPEGWKPPR